MSVSNRGNMDIPEYTYANDELARQRWYDWMLPGALLTFNTAPGVVQGSFGGWFGIYDEYDLYH